MDLKTMIDWMTKNMYPQDILKCLRSSTLSKEDRQQLEHLESETSTATTPGDITAMMAATSLGPSAVQDMFRKISRESLTKEIVSIKNKDQKADAIVQLCRRGGLQYNTITTSRGLRIETPDKLSISLDEALNECAKAEAIRMRLMLSERLEGAKGRAREMISMKKSNDVAPKKVSVLNDLDSDEESFGFGQKKPRRRKLTRSQKIFQKAAKLCKGKPNYTLCMKKMLKKMYK
jgi:hypothetical protein